MLLFAAESKALTHPYLARAWDKRGADLLVEAPGQAKRIAMMGALDWRDRGLIVATSKPSAAPTSSPFWKTSIIAMAPSPAPIQASFKDPWPSCSTTARSIPARRPGPPP